MNNFKILRISFVPITLILISLSLIVASTKLKPQEGNISASLNGQNSVIHIVQKGEYIDLIASKYGVKGKDVLKWNNLTADQIIYVGQKLTIWLPTKKLDIDTQIEDILNRLNIGVSYNNIQIMPEKAFNTKEPIKIIKFSPRGRFFAYSTKPRLSGNLGKVYISTKGERGYMKTETSIDASGQVKSIIFNNSEDLLALLTTTGYSIWEYKSEMSWEKKYQFVSKTYSAAFSPDGKSLYSAHGNIGKILNMKDGLLLTKIITNDNLPKKENFSGKYFTLAAFSPDGKILATGNQKGEVFIYNVKDYKYIKLI